MKHARRWIAIGLAALFVVGAVAYAGLSHLAFERLTTAAPRCEDRFSDYTPASFGTRGISGEFTAGGFDTAAFAMPGYREAGMLARNGFSVLMIDLRDHGDSYVEDGRSAWGTEEYLDVLGAWDWLRATQGLAAGRIGIAGESLGAASSMIAMAEEPSVAAVWADSGFADLGVLFGEKIGENGFPGWLAPGAMLWDWILAGDDLGSRNPLAAVERIGARPLAVVHGLADTSIPVHHATDLAAVHARFVPGFEAWLVPRAPHLQASFAEAGEYERRIVAFFRASLGA
jgi:dipeptidyl aminopeptidase/acylaminoacyl peptidase